MGRRLSRVIACIGILGLVNFAPVAQAHDDVNNPGTNDHENRPTAPTPQLGGVCAVAGTVVIGNHAGTGGVTATSKHHNHYRFVDTSITCQNLPGLGDDVSAFERTFSVEASGGTDGPPGETLQSAPVHGEDAAQGWSHKDCYAGGCTFSTLKGSFTDLYDGTKTNDGTQCTNCGEITAESVPAAVSSTSPANVVMFSRDANIVTAWGVLLFTGQALCLRAELEFTPIDFHEHTGGKHGGGMHAVQATLVGEALIWIDHVGDKAACGVNNHGGKKS